MLFTYRAMRALPAGLLFFITVSVASAQSLAPLNSSVGSTTQAASAKPSPQAEKSAAKTTDASANPHKPGEAPEKDQEPMIVVNVATRNAQAPDTTGTDTTVVTHSELQSGQYQDVADALREVGGLAVVPTGTPGQVTSDRKSVV